MWGSNSKIFHLACGLDRLAGAAYNGKADEIREGRIHNIIRTIFICQDIFTVNHVFAGTNNIHMLYRARVCFHLCQMYANSERGVK